MDDGGARQRHKIVGQRRRLFVTITVHTLVVSLAAINLVENVGLEPTTDSMPWILACPEHSPLKVVPNSGYAPLSLPCQGSVLTSELIGPVTDLGCLAGNDPAILVPQTSVYPLTL